MKIKIGVLFLLAFSVQPADSQNDPVSPLERKITLEVVNMPVSKVLKQIEKEARLSFSYNSEITAGLNPVTASFRNKKITEIVSLLFKDKIKCKIKNKYIVLYLDSKIPQSTAKNSSGGKSGNEKSSSKKEPSKGAVVFFKTSKSNSDTSLYHPTGTASLTSEGSDSSMNMDSVSSLPQQLFLINNDTTLLLLEEDTTETPK